MRKYIIAMTIFGLAVMLGPRSAQAGGSSDTSADVFHCYGFFEFQDFMNCNGGGLPAPGRPQLPSCPRAQVMVNESDQCLALEKYVELCDKYEAEGFVQSSQAGNTACSQGCANARFALPGCR